MERYKAYSTHLKELYGEKVYKLPVNLPVTCPNRMDGDGCTFCGGVGTGFEQNAIKQRNLSHIFRIIRTHSCRLTSLKSIW